MPSIFFHPIRAGRVASLAAAVAVAGTACGASSNHASASTAAAVRKAAARPCSLLTNDDIVAVLGAPVTATTALATTSCTYMLPSISKQPGEVDVLVAGGTQGRSEWRVDESDPVSTLSGIGDDAWTITNSQYHKIGVRKGDLYVFVTVVQDDPNAPAADALRTLAQDVMGHVT